MIRMGLMVVAIAIALGAVGINLSALAVFNRCGGRRHRPGLAEDRRQFHQRPHLAGRQIRKAGDLGHHRRQLGAHQRDEDRYISVAAGDGREFLIPNEDLVTQKVVNWTYTDKNTLVKVIFGTNYDADPRLVCKLAAETAAAAPRAIKGKPPNCI